MNTCCKNTLHRFMHSKESEIFEAKYCSGCGKKLRMGLAEKENWFFYLSDTYNPDESIRLIEEHEYNKYISKYVI